MPRIWSNLNQSQMPPLEVCTGAKPQTSSPYTGGHFSPGRLPHWLFILFPGDRYSSGEGGWELCIRSHLKQNKFIKTRPDMKSKFPTEEPVGLCNQNTVTVSHSAESTVRSCEHRWVGPQLVPKAHRKDRNTVHMLLRKVAIRWQETYEALNAAWGHLSDNDVLNPAPGVC